ncbi:MAG: amidohydrolase [Christensenellales bacterium]|jgi:5-methylthioadenosine/S-adenosylhomocysteine deaminase
MSVILLKNALILDGDSAEKGDVIVKDDRIFGVYPCGGAPADIKPQREINCEKKILMPALFNAHTHAAMTLFRGAGADLALQDWLFGVILPREEHLTPQDVYIGTLLAAAEMIRFGTAGFLDMYYFMKEVCRAGIDSGMRVCASCSKAVGEMSAEFQGAGGGRVNIIAALHAEYTATQEELDQALSFVQRYKLPLHVHVSETKGETEEGFLRRGKTPARFFSEGGFFDYGGVAAHGIWLSDEDITALKEKNVFVGHCPISNMKLSSGVMPIGKLMRAGVQVALGTDGCASNNNLNLFEEIRLVSLLHKGVGNDPAAVSSKEAFKMATRTGALACGFAESGMIKSGAKADIILLDIDVPHAVPMIDPYAHIAYSAQGSDVCMTMVDGKILYENGAYTGLDIKEISAKAQVCAQRLALS